MADVDGIEVRAGGGVVWRRNGDLLEVALVHRPKYDDWSLPKGKLDAGEDELDAAVREVEEETGLRCQVGPELASSRYDDRFSRAKKVRYWSMTPLSGSFSPSDEVDELLWASIEAAEGMLTYARDVDVLRSLPGGL